MAPGEATFPVCPGCGSMDIKPDAIPLVGQIFRCIDCCLRTAFVIEGETLDDARRIGAQIAADAEASPGTKG